MIPALFLSLSLSCSLALASHVQTDHLTPERSRRKLSVHLNAARSCWLQRGECPCPPPTRRTHIFFFGLCAGDCRAFSFFLSFFFYPPPRSHGDGFVSVLLQSSSFLPWPCWAAARPCRSPGCRTSALYLRRSGGTFQLC